MKKKPTTDAIPSLRKLAALQLDRVRGGGVASGKRRHDPVTYFVR